jgi:hypothetical protein
MKLEQLKEAARLEAANKYAHKLGLKSIMNS